MPDTGAVLSEAAAPTESIIGICQLGENRIAIPIDALSEVCQISVMSRISIRSPFLCGGIDLRGQLIPVINLSLICGLTEPAAQPPFAVVLRRAAQQLAVLVDHVIGISHIQAPRVHVLTQSAAGDDTACVRQVFIDEGQAISIIDVDRLFDLPGVYSVEIQPKARPSTVEDGRVPMLTCMVGGARFSVDATDVYGTLPRQGIEVGAMTSGYCLGSITYHQRRVPVLDTSSLLGLGRREHRAASEVVVLRCPSERLIGLAVDTIQDIRRIDLTRHARLPGTITRHHDFLTQVIMRENGVQTYVLSAKNLYSDPAVAIIAGLSSDPVKADAALGDGCTSGGRFLVVEVGRRFAVPLEQVTSIIPLPKEFIPVAQSVDGLVGFFARPPHSVPLIDLSALLGGGRGDTSQTQVLLFGEGEHQLGFQVERICSIETSTWRLEGLRNAGPGAETLVQLGVGSARHAAAVLDLEALARRHFSHPDAGSVENGGEVGSDPLPLNAG